MKLLKTNIGPRLGRDAGAFVSARSAGAAIMLRLRVARASQRQSRRRRLCDHLSPLDRLMCSSETSGLPLTVGREAMAAALLVVFLASAVVARSRNALVLSFVRVIASVWCFVHVAELLESVGFVRDAAMNSLLFVQRREELQK